MKKRKILIPGLLAMLLAGGGFVLTKFSEPTVPGPSPDRSETDPVALEQPPAQTPQLPLAVKDIYKTRMSSLKKAIEGNDWKSVELVWDEMLHDPGRDRRVALLTDFIRSVAPINPDLTLRLVKQMEIGAIRESIYSEMIRRVPLEKLVKFYESAQLIRDPEDSRALALQFVARGDPFADVFKLATGNRENDLGRYAFESAAFKVRTVDELRQVAALAPQFTSASQFSLPTEQFLRAAVFHLDQYGEKVDLDSLAMNEGLPMPIRQEAAKSHARKLAVNSPEEAVKYSLTRTVPGIGADALAATFPLWLRDQPVAATAWMDQTSDAGIQKLLIPQIVSYCEKHDMPVEANAWRAKLYKLDRYPVSKPQNP